LKILAQSMDPPPEEDEGPQRDVEAYAKWAKKGRVHALLC